MQIELGELHNFIRSEDVEGCKAWLESKPLGEAKKAVNERNKHQMTALHLAAWKGNAELIGLILRHRGDASAKAQDDFCALHFCAQSGGEKGCEMLANAAPKVLNMHTRKARRTPLMIAASKGHLDVCKVLVGCGAKIHLRGGGVHGARTAIDLAATEDVRDFLMEKLRERAALEDSGPSVECTEKSGNGAREEGARESPDKLRMGSGKGVGILEASCIAKPAEMASCVGPVERELIEKRKERKRRRRCLAAESGDTKRNTPRIQLMSFMDAEDD